MSSAAMAYQLPPGQDQQSPSQGQHAQHQQPSPSPATKTYNLYYTTSRTNLKLHLGSSSAPCIYYAESTFLTTDPQLQLRAGDSKSAPVVAIAKLHYTSRNILIACGDFQNDPEQNLVWEEMRRKKSRVQRSDYEFDTDVGLGERRMYGWRVEKHYAKTVYRCVDEEGGVVACMRSGGMLNWRKGGEVEVVVGLKGRLEELVIVGALAIWAAEAGWSVFNGYGGGKEGVGEKAVGAA